MKPAHVALSPWKCPCGDDHEQSVGGHLALSDFSAQGLPETVDMHVGGSAWKVPRAYIAFHGIKGFEVPELAKKYKWQEIKECENEPVLN